MLNDVLNPFLLEELMSTMKHQPPSVSIDGSNDTRLEKMNPVTMRIYDVRSGEIVTFPWTCARQLVLQQK